MAARSLAVFILLAVVVLGQSSLQVSAILLGKIHIDVENNLLKADVELHCKSKNDDLGNHVLSPGGTYNFTFQNNFWDITVYYCYVQWQKPDGKWAKAAFEIYKAKRDQQRCLHRCKWKIQETGLFSFNIQNYGWENLVTYTVEDKTSSPNNAPANAHYYLLTFSTLVAFLFIVTY